ncbi:MAG: CvpA family protein [Acidobacteriota bacterium]|jgi:membrane protein required for colicin V production|nr:CvpA family protein [Acidobacteriota bacterium]
MTLDQVHISYFDVVFAVLIGLSTVLAFFKGMFRELVNIAVSVLGFVLATLYYKAPAGWIAARGDMPGGVADLLGFLGVFLGCIVAGILVSAIADRFIKAVKLKWADRLLGAAFGFLRGWATSTVLVLALTAFPLSPAGMTSRSALVPYLLGSAGLVVHLVPEELKEKFDKRCREMLHDWNKGAADE